MIGAASTGIRALVSARRDVMMMGYTGGGMCELQLGGGGEGGGGGGRERGAGGGKRGDAQDIQKARPVGALEGTQRSVGKEGLLKSFPAARRRSRKLVCDDGNRTGGDA